MSTGTGIVIGCMWIFAGLLSLSATASDGTMRAGMFAAGVGTAIFGAFELLARL